MFGYATVTMISFRIRNECAGMIRVYMLALSLSLIKFERILQKTTTKTDAHCTCTTTATIPISIPSAYTRQRKQQKKCGFILSLLASEFNLTTNFSGFYFRPRAICSFSICFSLSIFNDFLNFSMRLFF